MSNTPTSRVQVVMDWVHKLHKELKLKLKMIKAYVIKQVECYVCFVRVYILQKQFR